MNATEAFSGLDIRAVRPIHSKFSTNLYVWLTFNTPRNQLVLAALLALRKLVQTDKPLAQRCQQLAVALQNDGVQPASPSRDLLRGERYGRHDAEDRLMLEAARLALELAMPNEEAGDRNLPSPDREGAWVRKLFERAIGGFYRTALDRGIWDVTCGGQPPTAGFTLGHGGS